MYIAQVMDSPKRVHYFSFSEHFATFSSTFCHKLLEVSIKLCNFAIRNALISDI